MNKIMVREKKNVWSSEETLEDRLEIEQAVIQAYNKINKKKDEEQKKKKIDLNVKYL